MSLRCSFSKQRIRSALSAIDRGESAGSESAWFNVDAGHKSGTGRIHLASRKATRAGARNLHSGASEVASEQEFAHRRPADIACTDEHDMHTAHPFVSLPN